VANLLLARATQSAGQLWKFQGSAPGQEELGGNAERNSEGQDGITVAACWIPALPRQPSGSLGRTAVRMMNAGFTELEINECGPAF
jgi:hypothetical protein